MNDQFESIIRQAIDNNVTDIHIMLKKTCLIYFRQTGNLHFKFSIDKNQGEKLFNYIRFCSKIDINYIKKPQTGHYHFSYNKKDYYLRVSSLPTFKSDSIVIRILNNHQKITIENLFYQTEITNYIKLITKRKYGLFIVSGATGSGKSTTLYTIIDEIHKRYKRNIVTLEDPIEITKPYCLQIQINEALGVTYYSALKQILRHDPDVIMIGEIRDEQTAKLAITCALTGHLVLATIHAGSAISTLLRLENLGCLRLDLQEILVGVLCQKMLYRKTINKPFVLCEIINTNDIQTYFSSNTIQYISFKQSLLTITKEIALLDIGDVIDE